MQSMNIERKIPEVKFRVPYSIGLLQNEIEEEYEINYVFQYQDQIVPETTYYQKEKNGSVTQYRLGKNMPQYLVVNYSEDKEQAWILKFRRGFTQKLRTMLGNDISTVTLGFSVHLFGGLVMHIRTVDAMREQQLEMTDYQDIFNIAQIQNLSEFLKNSTKKESAEYKELLKYPSLVKYSKTALATMSQKLNAKNSEENASVKEAEKGNTAYKMAEKYFTGDGVQKNYQEAARWYREAAEQGHMQAKMKMGMCYRYAYGVLRNEREAVRWYQKAAEQGSLEAYYTLGICYQYGIGVTKDFREAVKWYRKGADQGDAEAQKKIGECYYYGLGVPQDSKEAMKWYQKAAEPRSKSADEVENQVEHKLQKGTENGSTAYRMAERYFTGDGVQKNYQEAVFWYREAAEQGHVEAQNKLGICYRYAYGMPKNEREAVRWFRKAAEKGCLDAKKNLGIR